MSQAVYYRHGVRFEYPESWELTEEVQGGDVTITVSNVGTFWSLTLLRQRPRATQVLAEALDTFLEEYDELDEYPVQRLLNGEPSESLNLEFVALELINCVFLSAVEAGSRTLFVMAQVTDHERKDYESLFDGITASVQVASDSSDENAPPDTDLQGSE